jgi:hypothetical protein
VVGRLACWRPRSSSSAPKPNLTPGVPDHFEKHLLGGSARSLKLAFILDPLAGLKAYKDSSVAMMRAAEKRGHQVFAIDCAS